jgi:cytochrome c peroxidase
MITYNLSDYVGIGVIAIIMATLILGGVVLQDLAPDSGLRGRGRWLLMAGLGGMGILAFTAKLLVIILLMRMPGQMISAETMKRLQQHPTPLNVLPENVDPPAALRSPYQWEALPDMAPSPRWNQTTPEKVALGEKLFFDKSLSLNGEVSCASCHDVRHGAGVDGLETSKGIDGHIGKRNAPTVWNAAFQAKLFWDGRASSLEEQAKGPLTNPAEMGMPSLALVENRVASSPYYQTAFRGAFGDNTPISIENIVKAIAAYERTLITPDSAYDRFVKGDATALTPSQLRGMALFESVGCARCHSGPNFSEASIFSSNAPLRIFPVFNSGYVKKYDLLEDVGRSSPRVAWRVPSLRNVALTGPYFHNGKVYRLEDAVRVMLSTQLDRLDKAKPNADPTIVWSTSNQTITTLGRPAVKENDIKDITAFLRALSSDKLLKNGLNQHQSKG